MKMDRWKSIALTLIIVSVLIYLFSPNFLRLTKAYRQIQVLEDEIRTLQVQNQKIQDEIYSLKYDPIYIEKVAREDLGMSKPKEVIYKFEESQDNKDSNKGAIPNYDRCLLGSIKGFLVFLISLLTPAKRALTISKAISSGTPSGQTDLILISQGSLT